MLKTILLSTCVALSFSTAVSSQNFEKRDYNSLGIYEFFIDQQHPEWLSEIRGVKIVPVFNVSGRIVVKDSIIKTSLLILEPDSELIFDNYESKLWGIVADKIVINGSNIKIGRAADKMALVPAKAPDGTGGAYGHGHLGSDGAPGGHGTPGAVGSKGATVQIPTLVVATRNLEVKQGLDLSSISFNLNGISGSVGSAGGNGGNGGNAVGGQNGSTSIYKCRRQPGNGGNGGNAGAGGAGGAGGDGGDGGDLIFIANLKIGETLAKAKIFNEAGGGGASGQPGQGGVPGAGGSRGSREGFCQHRASDGSGGAGAPPPAISGPPGKAGDRGSELIVNVSEIGPLLR